MRALQLPGAVRVLVRDWLNANSVVLLHRSANVVVDTGYASHAEHTLALLRGPAYLADAPLRLVVNTHCHSDHMGGNALLARTYRCPIAVPNGEADLIRRWDTRELWLDFADQRAEAFGVDTELLADRIYRWGGMEWRALGAPGHDMHALVFYCEQERLLISGDALWENGFGVVLPDNPQAFAAARTTLETLSKLAIDTVIPGHGAPFNDVDAALERSFKRLEALAADPSRSARHVLKAMLAFKLLERGRLELATLPAYLDSVPVYRQYNRSYFGLPPAILAEQLVQELERAGVVALSEGDLIPA